MRRRGFFGLMAGAAAAGPSMAKQAIAGMESLSIGGNAGGLSSGLGYAGVEMAQKGFGPSEDYDPIKWARAELADFLGRSAADLMQQRLNTGVHMLDPDLAGMRAVSLGSKIRLQRDRNFERQLADHKGYLDRQIEQALKSAFS